MTAYFCLCLLLSSSLLMLVQPMVARMLLPHLGGAPSTWNTCMVFFQAGLLAGYAYAHLGPRWLGVRRHAIVHGALVVAAVFLLPIDLPSPDAPPTTPALWILKTLALGVAVPYVLLASTSTLLQVWFARRTGNDPYFLYAASNLGSFLGLLAYPWLVEPGLRLSEQAVLWRFGYFGFAALSLGAVVLSVATSGSLVEPVTPTIEKDRKRAACGYERVRWLLLAFAPSSLLLSVTNHLTADLASVPLLWVVPLALYLLTFVVAFARRQIVPHRAVAHYVPIVLLVLVFLWFSEATGPLAVIVGAHLIGFAWIALFCHGDLAATRPGTERLSEFYFWIALGGVLGGAFNALLAPMLFNAALEYPLALVLVGALCPAEAKSSPRGWLHAWLVGAACCVFALAGIGLEVPAGKSFLALLAVPLLATLYVPRPWPYALSLALVLSVGAIVPSVYGEIVDRKRSFFGVHRVVRDDGLVKLVHGNTVHGIQAPLSPREPLAYYHRGSPIGSLVQKMAPNSVGVVGLGSGALAAYGQKGVRFVFFEIDPDVESLARKHFTYLIDSRADVKVILGDARLTLGQSTEKFDLLVIDAFGSDSIPTHLLTAEAMELYQQRLNDGGLVAFHVSNRHLDLFPVLAAMTKFGWFGAQCDHATSSDDQRAGKLGSWWAALSRDPAVIKEYCPPPRWTSFDKAPKTTPWTDDFVDLAAVVRWRELLRDE